MRSPLICTVTACLLGAATLTSTAQADDPWTRTVDRSLTAKQLGLPADASPRRLARAAITRSARTLGLRGSLAGVRFNRSQAPIGGSTGAAPLRRLRFRQTVDGRRVLWSKIDVAVVQDHVTSITATTVPLNTTRLRGARRITPARARRVARRAVAGAEHALPARAIAYAGSPAKPRRPRRAYVVQTTPTRDQRGDDLEQSICVVIDAGSGKVLATYEGVAAQPRSAVRPRDPKANARAAAQPNITNALHYVYDAAGQDVPYGTFKHQWQTSGSVFAYGTDGGVLSQYFPTGNFIDISIRQLTDNALAVGEHMCVTRKFCGQTGAFGQQLGSHYALSITGNAPRSYYIPSRNRVYMSRGTSPAGDILAHELGHLMDFNYADDRSYTQQALEIQEGLADMFAYDYDRANATLGEDTGIVRRNWANPESTGDPSRMRDYACGLSEHFRHANSTILSHAYYRFVQKVGHHRAGDVLQYIPWFLPASPTFAHVATGFAQRSIDLYPNVKVNGRTIGQHALDAFYHEVGIGRDDPDC